MPNSSASLSQAEPEPTTPKLPPLAPGELAIRLRLVPPIVPVADGRKHKPFFAACAATPCSGPTEKLVFLAYAALAGPTGATWKVKGQRAHFYARQAKVATTAGCSVRTVYKMTMRLVQAGRLRRVQSGRGRIPHVFVVVPVGWDSQFRPERGADLNLVDRKDVPINRASSKRRAVNATRLEEEETPSPVTQPPLASRAAEAVPSKKHDPTKKLFVVARPEQAAKHIEDMRAIVQRTTAKDASTTEASTFNIDPDLEARMVEQDRLLHEGEKGVALSLDTPPAYMGECPHDRARGGFCEACGDDIRQFGEAY